jgi:hypothetical protein
MSEESSLKTFRFGILSTATISNKVACGINDCKYTTLVAVASRK